MPAHLLEELSTELSKCGATVRDTGVTGRYHVPVYEGVPQKILAVCPVQYRSLFEGRPIVRSNTDASLLTDDNAALFALNSILGEPADWYLTMSAATAELPESGPSHFLLSFGTDAIPQSIARTFTIVKPTLKVEETTGPETLLPDKNEPASASHGYPKDAIAIIGMGCRFPGSDSIDEFWDCLKSGRSMLSEVNSSRFGKDRSSRSPKTLRYWGNFLEDVESFDHGFFKKSPREAGSMDPQQRILLQIAYEALETSGYFTHSSNPEDIGVYLGACASDYDFNLACHPPTACKYASNV